MRINELKALRINKSLSQKEVGRLISKNEHYISEIEYGKCEVKLEDGYLLSKIYNVTIEELYIASKTFL